MGSFTKIAEAKISKKHRHTHNLEDHD